MQKALDYFRALSRRIEGERVAYLAQSKDLLETINTTAAGGVSIEAKGGDATRIRAELRRLKRERAALVAPSFIDPLPDIENYARAHPKAVAAEPVSFKIPNGQTPLAVHNNLAEKTTAVLAEIARVITAPAAPGDLSADLTAQLDAMATPPRIVEGKIVFPKHVVDSNGTVLTVVNTEGLFAWLHRDALIAGATKLAEGVGPGMTAAARSEALATLYEKFAMALRVEAAAAMAAEQAQQRVIRRRHVHPAILLGVQVPAATVYEWHSKKRGV